MIVIMAAMIRCDPRQPVRSQAGRCEKESVHTGSVRKELTLW